MDVGVVVVHLHDGAADRNIVNNVAVTAIADVGIAWLSTLKFLIRILKCAVTIVIVCIPKIESIGVGVPVT